MTGREFEDPLNFNPQGESAPALESDRIQSNCGLFAMIDVSGLPAPGIKLADITYHAGKKLQHRAEGAAGYAVFDSLGSGNFIKGTDRIDVAFENGRRIPIVEDGRITILHTRYPTSGKGSEHEENTQPLTLDGITLAHHGNLSNVDHIIDRLGDIPFYGEYPNSDSWIALNAILQANGEGLSEKMINAQKDFKGGWAFIATDGKGIVASRDPEGIRPLFLGVVGSWEDPEAYALSVEDSAFHVSNSGINEHREIRPGETISIYGNEVITEELKPSPDQRACVFELVYMMDPDSEFMGQNVAAARVRAGNRLWHEQPISVEDGEHITIMPVPESGRDYESGYFEEAVKELGSRVTRIEGIKKKRHEGRSFIQPEGKRDPSDKFMVIPELVKDKKVLLVDDTLVRGTTMGGENGFKGLVQKLREAGASEVHLRLGAPEVVNPCYWGVDFPTHDELSAYEYPDPEERARILGLDSLGYLSLDGMLEAFGADEKTRNNFNAHCFGGNSPRYVPNTEQNRDFVRVDR